MSQSIATTALAPIMSEAGIKPACSPQFSGSQSPRYGSKCVVVALLEDLPENGLLRAQVGTIVETLAPGVYEVEFSDDSGRTYASLALRGDQLMRLHHEPRHQAA